MRKMNREELRPFMLMVSGIVCLIIGLYLMYTVIASSGNATVIIIFLGGGGGLTWYGRKEWKKMRGDW